MNEPIRASFVVPGLAREEAFAALLDVERFPAWASGLAGARLLKPPDGSPENAREATIPPGSTIEFSLSAAGMRHTVISAVTIVEPPRLLEWRYVRGAAGAGGWTLEDLGHAVEMSLYTSYEVKPPWLDRLANRPFIRGLVEDLLRRSMRRFVEVGIRRQPSGIRKSLPGASPD